MTLDLNETIQPYKHFEGKNIEQMPLLIKEGRIPISVTGLMQRRLYSGKQDWKNNYFDTGDAFVYHPDGRVKIVLDAPPLRTLNPESTLKNGGLVLEDGVYETLLGPEFVRDTLTDMLEHDLSAEEVKTHPIWRAFARDYALLNEYTDRMFAEMKKEYNYEIAMSVYLPSKEKVPTLRAAYVYGLEVRSQLGSWGGLDFGSGRLVGVAPEALSASGNASQFNLEKALLLVNERLLASGLKLFN